MNAWKRVGLRGRLMLALAGVAVLSVALATVLADSGLNGHLGQSAGQLQHRLYTDHMLAAAVALLPALLAAVFVASRLTRPLRRLADAAKRIERGKLDARVQPEGTPETAALGRAFNRLAETLEHEEQIRRAAAADVAHELRTPLAGIVSRIEAAQDGVLADEQRNLAAIHAEALRLSQLVDDLGKLAEAEQPGLTLHKQPVDLGALLAERVDVHREQLAVKSVALEQRIEPAHVYGDPGRLAQILDNLLSNALRYTPSGGKISVELTQPNAKAILVIADSGVGIAGEDLPYIFERFWRGEQSRARHTGGAGIGLAIVRELVRAHDGRIDVQSKPSQGSRFTVSLPAAPA
jgi:two-component system, OmpR family, sensor histidine kinase BaeS